MSWDIESMALRYRAGCLELLDQRLLPQQEVWLSMQEPADMLEAIRELKVRGAPLIGVAAAMALADCAYKGADYEAFCLYAEKLRQTRPTAVNLMKSLDRMLMVAKTNYQSTALLEEALGIFREDYELCARIAANGSELIASGQNILTHCNTGGLATAGGGTALGVLRKCHEQGKKLHVYVDETRPLLQGGRLTTYELKKLNIDHTLICDNMAGFLMAQGKIDQVIVGADRIAANGDFANKVGTYSLAVLCFYHRIPFIVAAPYTTLDTSCLSGREIPIEERGHHEVTALVGAEETSMAYNPAFDVTPHELVSYWVLDTGVYSLSEVKKGCLT